jgi:hypothetical protein
VILLNLLKVHHYSRQHSDVVHGSIVGLGIMPQAKRLWASNPMRSLHFSVYLILSATLDPGIYSDSNRNECQNEKINISGENCVANIEANNLTAICELTVYSVGASTFHSPMGLHDLLQRQLLLHFCTMLHTIFWDITLCSPSQIGPSSTAPLCFTPVFLLHQQNYHLWGPT